MCIRDRVPSHRAEIALLEAARARAAADYRATATIDDVRSCAVLALRQRRSSFIVGHAEAMARESADIQAALNQDGLGKQ